MEESQESELKPTLISEIEPIEESSGQMITHRSKIKELVEPPLVPACESLYDKNIQTFSSSANRKNVGESGFIYIDYESLSPENKAIAEKHAKIVNLKKRGKAAKIEIPIEEKTTSDEIETTATAAAQLFKKQRMDWAPKYTIEQLREIYGTDPNDQQFGPEGFQQEGWYYDPESKLFYMSKEHSQKAKEEIEE